MFIFIKSHSEKRITTRFDGKSITQDQIASEALETHWPDWTKGWSFRSLDPPQNSCISVPRWRACEGL